MKNLNQPSELPDIILSGIQGAGKGTQSDLLKQMGYKAFSAGDALRALAQTDSPNAAIVDAHQKAGTFAPDPIVMEAVGEAMKNADPNVPMIFDGMPRNLEQKEALDKILAETERKFIAINLMLPEAVAKERMMSRGRSDDTPEAIEKRISLYNQKTRPVVGAYEQDGVLFDVNAEGSPEEVNQILVEHILNYNKRMMEIVNS